MENLMTLVTTALEWSYLAGETKVRAEQLKSAAELLVLRHDTLKLIDGTGPDALRTDQNKAEKARMNGKEPERQTVPESERAETFQPVGTAEQQAQTSTAPTCTFYGGLVPSDLKRFTGSGISLVECPDCERMSSLSPSKGVLRFTPHTRRKQQAPLTEKHWSATGKTNWSVVEG